MHVFINILPAGVLPFAEAEEEGELASIREVDEQQASLSGSQYSQGKSGENTSPSQPENSASDSQSQDKSGDDKLTVSSPINLAIHHHNHRSHFTSCYNHFEVRPNLIPKCKAIGSVPGIYQDVT